MIVAGAVAYFLLIGKYEMEPSLISKVNTFAQIILGLAIVLSESLLGFLPAWLTDWLVLVVLGTTVVSGADYVWTWGRRAIEARRANGGNRL